MLPEVPSPASLLLSIKDTSKHSPATSGQSAVVEPLTHDPNSEVVFLVMCDPSMNEL